eukprot:2611403-Pleurochrysis_carterae.AAC.3
MIAHEYFRVSSISHDYLKIDDAPRGSVDPRGLHPRRYARCAVRAPIQDQSDRPRIRRVQI